MITATDLAVAAYWLTNLVLRLEELGAIEPADAEKVRAISALLAEVAKEDVLT